ncbi:MAG TPA: SusC/RagA family TonB-linked outer membrane protein [Pedobacter sp.]
MKLTTFMILIGFLQVNASAFGQRVQLSEKNISYDKLFKQIHKQTGYTFFYKEGSLSDLPKIDVQLNDATIREVLDQCFKNKPLTYLIIDNSIVIRRNPVISFTKPVSAMIYIIGKVVDSHNQPLPGVGIKQKGTDYRWSTDAKGEFRAVVQNADAVLQFSYIGFMMQEVKVKDLKTPVVIILKEDISKLDEVQVVAYGTTTKRLSTGDQTTISAKDIAKYPTNNALDVLQGSVPGLGVFKNSGNANSTYKVQVRGINGLRGSQPLYIVDGIPYQGGSYNTQNLTLGANTANGSLGQGGDALNFINPSDIESISVLKDADATSIYGARAADGVIIITTKKGKIGAPRIDASVYTGITQVGHIPDMLNLQQYLQMRREAKKNDNTAIAAADYDINGVWDTTRNNNWAKQLLGGTGRVTNAQAGISGGTERMQYRISTGYNKQTNLTDLNGSSQTANLNVSLGTSTADNKFSVQFNGGYLYNLNTTTQSDLISSITLAPDAPVLTNPDGSLNFQNNTFSNPLVARNYMNSSPSTNLTSSTVLSYKPVNKLEFKATLGYNKQEVNEFLGSPSTVVAPFQTTQPSSTFTYNNNTYWSIEPQVNYNTNISKGKLTATVGSSLQKEIVESTQLRVTGYSSDLLLRSISGGTTITNISPYSYYPAKNTALFGRVSYNWDNKYIINFSGRYDGSSRFGEDRQFHLFSAVGAAWILSDEGFMKNNLPFINFAKLRGSYGATGRDSGLIPYSFLDTYGSTTLPYQGVAGLLPNRLPNPDLSWETTKKADAGIDLQFLKGRISLTSNYYRNRTSGILNGSLLSAVTGFTSIQQNLPAIVQNKGFDLSVTTSNINTANFEWSSTILFTRERNKLLSYPNLNSSSYANTYIVGEPINLLRLYKFAGVNSQTGVYQFYAANGSIVTNPATADRTATIDINPDFYGSLQNRFRYKQFTLDFLFRFVKQKGRNAFGQMGALPAGLAANTNYSTIILDRWQKPGDIADIQRYGTVFTLFTSQGYATQSDHAYGDASYIRLQNLSLAYQFTSPLLKKMHLQNLQLYIQGDNLLTISKYGAIDPENQSYSSLPPLRTITTGLRLTL